MKQAPTDEATVVRHGRNVIGVLVCVFAAVNQLARLGHQQTRPRLLRHSCMTSQDIPVENNQTPPTMRTMPATRAI
jgi:hypothetical protein